MAFFRKVNLAAALETTEEWRELKSKIWAV